MYLAYIIETAQVVLATNDAFRQFASGWGDFSELNNMGLEWLTIKISTGLIAILTQTFYAWRIYVLGGNIWLSLTVAIVRQLVVSVTGPD